MSGLTYRKNPFCSIKVSFLSVRPLMVALPKSPQHESTLAETRGILYSSLLTLFSGNDSSLNHSSQNSSSFPSLIPSCSRNIKTYHQIPNFFSSFPRRISLIQKYIYVTIPHKCPFENYNCVLSQFLPLCEPASLKN